MKREDVESTVNRILTEEFELAPERIKADAKLIEDLELDSLDAVDLVAALESALGGRIAEEEARKVRTVGDIYRLVLGEVARRS